MPSSTDFECPLCEKIFTVQGLYNDEYVTCPHCGQLLSVADLLYDPEREWQEEYDGLMDYERWLEDDEPD